jgi:hypothetical protein
MPWSAATRRRLGKFLFSILKHDNKAAPGRRTPKESFRAFAFFFRACHIPAVTLFQVSVSFLLQSSNG